MGGDSTLCAHTYRLKYIAVGSIPVVGIPLLPVL